MTRKDLVAVVIALTLVALCGPKAVSGDARTAVGDSAYLRTDVGLMTPISTMVREASVVARVRITGRSPVTPTGIDEHAHPGEVCGYYYHAVVLEALKGGGSPVNFFMSEDKDFQGYELEYLVFALRRNPEAWLTHIRSISAMMDDADLTKQICRSFGNLYVPTKIQLLVPFDTSAQRIFGGRWANFGRRSMTLCANGLGEPATGYLSVRRNPADQNSDLVGWPGLKKFILAALNDKWRFWSGDRLLGC